MSDERIKYFDELGDLVLSIELHAPGSDLGGLAANGLGILKKIVKILESSPNYEHGLQRVPDVEVFLENLRDDFRISEEELKILKKNYSWFRGNSHAGRHSRIPDFPD